MNKKPRIEEYHEPAGGWGAAMATGAVLWQQGVLLKSGAALFFMNKPGGFKCPSCAWPDPASGSARLVFCENGAKALAWESTKKRATAEFFAKYSVTELARQSDYWLEQQGRITHPMIYDFGSDHYVPIEWQKALAVIGRELRALSHPNEAEFYTSGRSSNEAAFLYQLFAREFGTNNFPDCSNFCHEASSQGLPPAIGVGKGTCLLEDFNHADAVFIFGQNTGTNSPRMMTELRSAARRGARIVVFNPLRERALERFQAPQNLLEMATMTSTPIASNYYQLKVGGDVAAVKGIMKATIEADDRAQSNDEPRVLDVDFLEGHTAGFEPFCNDLRAPTPWPMIERHSGLSRAQIEEAAQVYLEANRVMVCYGMGITQHFRGTQNVQQLVNLLLLRGNIGRPGTGIAPVRGHSNVQGDRTVGITERPAAEFLDRLEKVFGFHPPREHGHDAVHALQAIVQGRAKAFIGLGGNFVAASPDTPVISEAFRQLTLTAHVATKLNRSHLVHGRNALILPCLARSEVDRSPNGAMQEVTIEDSMSIVQASRGMLVPASPHLRSEPWIVAHLARATLGERSVVPWEWLVEDYSRIRDKIEGVFPIFQGYNARIRIPGGFHLTNTGRDRIWKTPNGRANFILFSGLDEDQHASNPDALWLCTIRSHDQYNTTIYSNSDRYRGVFNQRDVVFLNDAEMRKRGLAPGDRVDLETLSSDKIERIVRGLAVVRYNVPDGSCAAYYPEANPLIPLHLYDPQSGTPSAKAIPVVLKKSSIDPTNIQSSADVKS